MSLQLEGELADQAFLVQRQEFATEVSDDAVVAQSVAKKTGLREIRLVGTADSTLLLSGETGTGKELLADAVHQ